MPRLYIFALCEKVITDKDGRTSLISLFNDISAQILPTAPDIPPNAIAAKEWWAYASWEIEPGDIGKEYRQLIQLFYPKGEPFSAPVEVKFSPESGKTHQQVTVNGMGFPIGQVGLYTMKMWLEYGGSTIIESSPIIINVTHNKLDELPPGLISFA